MDRRQLVTGSLAAVGLAPALAAAQPLPKKKLIKVAFMLGEGANVIDTAGPWEAFQDAMPPGPDGQMHHPFALFTVAPTEEPVRMTGGLLVKPHYSIDKAPQPDVIVVPAHRSTDASRAWLKAASEKTDITMSVCTGAFQLGRVGLLDGLKATTHHEYYDAFQKEFPKVTLERTPRFVDSGRIATAGGLTSGIDLALHVIGRYFGPDVAAATARYMEHTQTARVV